MPKSEKFGGLAEPVYGALIGDVRRSRRIKDRRKFQRDLEDILEDLNERLQDSLVAALVITTGDEFQGLYRDASGLLATMVTVDEHFPTSDFYFGIGLGGLSTTLKQKAVGMDGPCFHHARDALDNAKKHDRWAQVHLDDEKTHRAINALLALMSAVRREWTIKQTNYVSSMRSATSQKAVAGKHRVSASVISESLRSAHYKELIEGEKTVVRLLEEIWAGAPAKEMKER